MSVVGSLCPLYVRSFRCRFVISVVMYGLSPIITSMEGNKYFILFLCGAVEIPATIIIAFILKRYDLGTCNSNNM